MEENCVREIVFCDRGAQIWNAMVLLGVNKDNAITITESYKDFAPSLRVRKSVERLISGIPSNQLLGLREVVLTNTGNLNRDRRRGQLWSRGHKVKIRECLGLYHGSQNGQCAWIELFVDSILDLWPPYVLRFPPFCDMHVGNILFHEIGHHIHKTQSPEHAEEEKVANKWRQRLTRRYFFRKYWYLIPLLFTLSMTAKLVVVIVGRMENRKERD